MGWVLKSFTQVLDRAWVECSLLLWVYISRIVLERLQVYLGAQEAIRTVLPCVIHSDKR